MTPTKDTPIINGSWDSPAPNMVDRWAKPKDTPHPGKNILVDRVEYTPKETWTEELKDMLSDAGLKPIQFKLNNQGVRIINRVAQELNSPKRKVQER